MVINVISLFCGCGGSSLGYKRANCNIALATDFNPKVLQTYQLNFPQTQILQADIRNITGHILEELTAIKPGQLDILDGSPPCTPFSTSGLRDKSWNKIYQHTGELTYQATNDLFYEYVRIVEEYRPKTFIAENVKGLIIGKAKGYFKNIIRKLENLNYNVLTFDLNAKDFEVAQSRPRIIITGIRNDINQNKAIQLKTHPIISFYEATKNLAILESEKQKQRQVYANGQRIQFLNRCKGLQSADDYHPKLQGFNFIKVDLHKPCPTIVAHSSQLIHPTEKRYLTLTEIKRLASFPNDFKFLSIHDAHIRIGNSVPPNLIKNIALYIINRAQLSQCQNIPINNVK